MSKRLDPEIAALARRPKQLERRAEELTQMMKPLREAADAVFKEQEVLFEQRMLLANRKLVGRRVRLRGWFGGDLRPFNSQEGIMLSATRTHCVVRFGEQPVKLHLLNVRGADEELHDRLMAGEEVGSGEPVTPGNHNPKRRAECANTK
jgi:hypothetical protein